MGCLPKELADRSDASDITEIWAHYHLEYAEYKEKEREREREARAKGRKR